MLGLDNDDNINSSQHLLVMARGNGPLDVTGCLPWAWASGLVVAGLMGRLFCAFAHLILTRACGYQCFQRGELGFEELRCFSCSPIAASPPVSTRAQSQELATPSFPWQGGSQPELRRGSHTQKEQGEDPPAALCGPLNPAGLLLDTPKFGELVSPLSPDVIRVEFLPPEKSTLIKHLI